jgi:hypothetical protein
MVYTKTVEPPDNLPTGILDADGVERRLLDLTDEIWEVAGTLRDLVGEFGEQLTVFLVKRRRKGLAA